MEKYTLQEYANLLQNLRMMKEFYSNGEEEKNVGYLTYDSREVTEGTLFICKGAAFLFRKHILLLHILQH